VGHITDPPLVGEHIDAAHANNATNAIQLTSCFQIGDRHKNSIGLLPFIHFIFNKHEMTEDRQRVISLWLIIAGLNKPAFINNCGK
jgi:hypothetical protein